MRSMSSSVRMVEWHSLEWPAFSTQWCPSVRSLTWSCRFPPYPSPGHYVVFVDLSERNVSFTQYGSEPLTHDWDARDPAAVPGR